MLVHKPAEILVAGFVRGLDKLDLGLNTSLCGVEHHEAVGDIVVELYWLDN